MLLTQLLVIGLRVEQFRGNRAPNFKSLARLLPELHSTQSYYHYLLILDARETVKVVFVAKIV